MDILRPPSSDEGEISDGSGDEQKKTTEKSPDYAPRSPDYNPSKTPPKNRTEEGATKEDKKKDKHHHHHHKHHKDVSKETPEKKDQDEPDSASALRDRESMLRNRLLAKSKEREGGANREKEKQEKRELEKAIEIKVREEKAKLKERREKEEKRRKEEKSEKREEIVEKKEEEEQHDDVEVFQVQPKADLNIRTRVSFPGEQRSGGGERKDRRELESKERERDRERERAPAEKDRERERDSRRREDVRGSGRDRPPDRREDRDRDRMRSKYEEKERDRDRTAKDRKRERERREERDKDRRRPRDVKAPKRSRTRSASSERDAKREKKAVNEKKVEQKESTQAAPLGEEQKVPSPDLMEEGEAAPTPTPYEDEKTRRPGYSKFDSESEHEEELVHEDDLMRSPAYSPVPMKESDEEEGDNDFDFDPALVPFDELTEEQKAGLSPAYVKDLEKRWQKSLIDQLPVYFAGIYGCRNVREFDCMNRIEEGTFGVVYRAKEKRTDEVVALKRLKMEKEKDGFPITSLREINMLLKAGGHPNVVNVREIVIGDNIDKIFLVMEFVEHDMKSLMDTMKKKGKRFEVGHVKTLLRQLLSGLSHMHMLWILHRDLKTSNLLLTHDGILKIADFGLAREYGEPLGKYTEIVVTLWYRAPELLLGTKLYSTPIDVWSVGCIMAEFIRLKPLWPGRGEAEQIDLIFKDLGTPIVDKWPEVESLPLWEKFGFKKYPYNQLRGKFEAETLNETAWKLLNGMLTYNPEKRLTADQALEHPWFTEEPLPIPPDQFPTFPAKSEQGKAPPKKEVEVEPPVKEKHVALDEKTSELLAALNVPKHQVKSTGFSIKFDKNKF